jgi:hypothetical protein
MMMDSPAQRTLRLASDFCFLYLVLAIYCVYVDGGLVAMVWKFGVMWILQRATTSLKDPRAQRTPASSGIVELDDFPGNQNVSPIAHRTVGLRWCRAVALHGLPLIMHLFACLGNPLHNDYTPSSSAGGVMSEFDYLALQRDIAAAGDMPAAALRWQGTTQSTKFWSFSAGPELVSVGKLVGLDVLTIVVLYIVLSLFVSVSGGALPPYGLVQLLPLRDATDAHNDRSDEDVRGTAPRQARETL